MVVVEPDGLHRYTVKEIASQIKKAGTVLAASNAMGISRDKLGRFAREHNLSGQVRMHDDDKLRKLVARGLTLEDIGKAFGQTRERARQRIVALGLTDEHKQARAALVAQQRAASKDAEIKEILTTGKVVTRRQRQLAAHELRTVIPTAPRHRKRGYTQDELVSVLRQAYGIGEELPLTIDRYDNIRITRRSSVPGGRHETMMLADGRNWPTTQTICRYLGGSFPAACERAGVICGEAKRDNYESQWDDDDLRFVLRAFALKSIAEGRMPTIPGLRAWIKENRGPLHGTTYQAKEGSKPKEYSRTDFSMEINGVWKEVPSVGWIRKRIPSIQAVFEEVMAEERQRVLDERISVGA